MTATRRTHVLAGYGGEWECVDGHVGYSPPALGIPLRCLFGSCRSRVRRTGEGSREANLRLRLELAERAKRTSAAVEARRRRGRL